MAKKAKGNRVQVILECTEHKASGMPGTSRYITTKSRKNTTARLELMHSSPILKRGTVLNVGVCRPHLYAPKPPKIWQRKQWPPCKKVKAVHTARSSKWLSPPRPAPMSSKKKWFRTTQLRTHSNNPFSERQQRSGWCSASPAALFLHAYTFNPT